MAPALPNGVVILMAQTVARRTARADVWGRYDANDLMIVDEAHHATAEGWTRAMRQWPGAVLGMTATPWRLSRREGFDHLFAQLVCGPQVAALQSYGWLCVVRVMSPPEGELVLGGSVDATGDYSEPGIEEANRGRDIWTGGALRFWQRHGEGRQTVVYAVSVTHARNLAGVFNDSGIPAGVLVADTPNVERSETIERFRTGLLTVLVNVAVATEGFDLPDAACILLTRPTMSLALYLQMVGRGLRPKPNSGDCIVLDLAGNSLVHGLPDSEREWSLLARGELPLGDMPLVRCEHCEALSAAAAHHCVNCGEPFGEDCGRCGAWRAWKRWTRRSMCGESHDEVCDLCHYDAHLLANLPVTEELEELAIMAIDDELSPRRDPFFKDLLEEERRRLGGTPEDRLADLRPMVELRERELNDQEFLDRLFEEHRDALPINLRPASWRQTTKLYVEWEDKLRSELRGWKDEIARLETQTVDGQLVLRNVRERLMRLLDAEARAARLIHGTQSHDMTRQGLGQEDSGIVTASFHGEGWISLAELTQRQNKNEKSNLRDFRGPRGYEKTIKNWRELLVETAEWLIQEGLLEANASGIKVGNATRNLIHTNSRAFQNPKQLSNGLYIDTWGNKDTVAKRVSLLVQKFSQYPAEFHVQFAQ